MIKDQELSSNIYTFKCDQIISNYYKYLLNIFIICDFLSVFASVCAAVVKTSAAAPVGE